jgi:secreted trypsin-like serine protease
MGPSDVPDLLIAIVHMQFSTAHTAFTLTFAFAASSLVACTGGDHPLDTREKLELSSASQPIFGGQLDTDHPEVLFLFDLTGASCTGTNIRTEAGRGFLLTAAHCVTVDVPGPGVVPIDPERFVVVPGEDVAESEVFFAVEEIAVEPGYDGSAADDDIAVVRYFFGNDAAPPTLEPLTPADDDLEIGDDLLLVGYGLTEDGDFNTERRQVGRRLDDLNGDLIAFSQADGRGACFGDSGGPGLVEVDGEERVGLVISTGVSDSEIPCVDGFTLGMRVSAYADFIDDFLEEDLPRAALAGSAE